MGLTTEFWDAVEACRTTRELDAVLEGIGPPSDEADQMEAVRRITDLGNRHLYDPGAYPGGVLDYWFSGGYHAEERRVANEVATAGFFFECGGDGPALSEAELAELERRIAATDPYPFVDVELPDGTERALPKYDEEGNEREFRVHEGRIQYRTRVRPTKGLWETVPADIEWVWDRWIPARMLTILDGDSKIGKSLSFADIAARLSRGGKMPDGQQAAPGGVAFLYLCHEDLWAETTVPRLLAAGAHPERFELVKGKPQRLKTDEVTWESIALPLDVGYLDGIVGATRARTGCAHVVVFADPLMAVIDGRLDAYNYKQTIAALAPVQRFCQESDVAFVGVRHLTKTNASGKALHGGQGSVAFVSSARSVLQVAYDPDDDTAETEGRRRVLMSAGTNLARAPRTLTFGIGTKEIEVGSKRRKEAVIVWGGESDVTADEVALIQQGSRGPGARAEAMIRRALQDGPLWHAKLFETIQAETGASDSTVFRSIERLIERNHVLKRRVPRKGFGAGQGRVWYALREHADELEKVVEE